MAIVSWDVTEGDCDARKDQMKPNCVLCPHECRAASVRGELLCTTRTANCMSRRLSRATSQVKWSGRIQGQPFARSRNGPHHGFGLPTRLFRSVRVIEHADGSSATQPPSRGTSKRKRFCGGVVTHFSCICLFLVLMNLPLYAFQQTLETASVFFGTDAAEIFRRSPAALYALWHLLPAQCFDQRW